MKSYPRDIRAGLIFPPSRHKRTYTQSSSCVTSVSSTYQVSRYQKTLEPADTYNDISQQSSDSQISRVDQRRYQMHLCETRCSTPRRMGRESHGTFGRSAG